VVVKDVKLGRGTISMYIGIVESYSATAARKSRVGVGRERK
jgi:hypothetical protein